ncbi:MAG: AsmA-like C-terminal region-containing protein, partial [Daejeonella sp.]|nr:AsmA-like C-terminal region-containing protein [Daejeonella sp.]
GRRYIYGTVNVKEGAAAYNPRNLLFKDIKMLMNFKGEDLFLENLKVKSGTTSLAMEAVLKNFSNFYYTDPQKILIDWKVKSPNVNLNEFLAFLGKRRQGSNPKGKRFTGNLDKMLEQASMVMEVEVDRLIYKNFEGKDLRSNITLKQSGILINRMSIKQGGGSMDIKGNIDQSGTVNHFNMNSRINNVNVQNLFYAFENFGQDAITDKNLRGTFFGDASVSGSMLPSGKIVPLSLSGKVSFDIRNGSLINFEPMYKIGNFAFPNRNFSNITFMNLKNTLSISQNKVTIPPMEIRSSVLNIFLSGVYSFGKGTDIGMRIPLRNPRKDELITDIDEKRERSLKGIVLNLRAVDGEDGKVKFRLGKKSEKAED